MSGFNQRARRYRFVTEISFKVEAIRGPSVECGAMHAGAAFFSSRCEIPGRSGGRTRYAGSRVVREERSRERARQGRRTPGERDADLPKPRAGSRVTCRPRNAAHDVDHFLSVVREVQEGPGVGHAAESRLSAPERADHGSMKVCQGMPVTASSFSAVAREAPYMPRRSRETWAREILSFFDRERSLSFGDCPSIHCCNVTMRRLYAHGTLERKPSCA